jgi:hypothetical protein
MQKGKEKNSHSERHSLHGLNCHRCFWKSQSARRLTIFKGIFLRYANLLIKALQLLPMGIKKRAKRRESVDPQSIPIS